MSTNQTNIQIQNFFSEMSSFLVKKNTDYDDTWRKPSHLVPSGKPKERLLYRIEEKLGRLVRQMDVENNSPAPGEKLQARGDLMDTAKDLVGCFTLLTLLLREEYAEAPKTEK